MIGRRTANVPITTHRWHLKKPHARLNARKQATSIYLYVHVDACMHAPTRARTCAYVQACKSVYARAHALSKKIRTYTRYNNKQINMRTHSRTHTHARTHARTHTHTRTQINKQSSTHACAHHIHTHIYTHTHAHTHARTQTQ